MHESEESHTVLDVAQLRTVAAPRLLWRLVSLGCVDHSSIARCGILSSGDLGWTHFRGSTVHLQVYQVAAKVNRM